MGNKIISENKLNSVMLLDKCISEAINSIEELEELKYKRLIYDSVSENRINALLDQIYNDRAKANYRSAIRKCIFIIKYIDKEKEGIE